MKESQGLGPMKNLIQVRTDNPQNNPMQTNSTQGNNTDKNAQFVDDSQKQFSKAMAWYYLVP